MSGITAATVTAAAAVAAVGASLYQGQQQAGAQKKAANQATANAKATATAAERDMNKRNAQGPNTSAMYSANQQAAQSGIGGTNLTGPGGVDPNSLALGKQTLLGA